jgi:hypothetical protein
MEPKLFDSLSIYLGRGYCFEMEPKLFNCFLIIHLNTGNCPEMEPKLFDSLSIYLDTCYCSEMEPKLFTCLSIIHFGKGNCTEMELKLFDSLSIYVFGHRLFWDGTQAGLLL